MTGRKEIVGGEMFGSGRLVMDRGDMDMRRWEREEWMEGGLAMEAAKRDFCLA